MEQASVRPLSRVRIQPFVVAEGKRERGKEREREREREREIVCKPLFSEPKADVTVL